MSSGSKELMDRLHKLPISDSIRISCLQYFTVKMSEGIVATSYKSGDKFFIDPAKLLPLERFLPQPKGAAPRGGAAGGRGEHQLGRQQ